MTLRVALMALNASGLSGVPRYTAALCRALDAVAGERSDLELELVATPAGAELIGARWLPVRRLWPARRGDMTRAARLVAEQLAPPMLAADLIHYFDVGGPLLTRRRPFVFTFHDAAVCRPETSHFGRLQRARKLRQIPWSFARAAQVVAVSSFAKDEAVRHFHVSPDRITVVHSGPGLLTEPAPAPDSQPQRPYVLFVGSLTASKNVPFLVRAYDRAAPDADLVLAGRTLDDMEAISAAIDASRLRARIRIVAEPSDGELDRLYRGATAFAFPSLYEGFGFPPLEAMARDCPVLASDIPAMREIAGEGSLLLPLEEGAWAEQLRRVVSDGGAREELRARGRRAVARYSWERTARELCGVLLRAGAAPST